MGHFAEKNERTLKWDVPLKCVTSVRFRKVTARQRGLVKSMVLSEIKQISTYSDDL